MERLREIWGRLRQDSALILLIALAVGACLLLPREPPQGAGGDREEARLAEVLSAMAGAGRVEVVVRWTEHGTSAAGERIPLGAVVIAQGASDIGVRLKLSRAVTTLLDLPPGAVEVFAMEQEGT